MKNKDEPGSQDVVVKMAPQFAYFAAAEVDDAAVADAADETSAAAAVAVVAADSVAVEAVEEFAWVKLL